MHLLLQDICRAVTKGEWKLPKHIMLSTSVRHLYRSKVLTTILNRLGHCETHDFSLELEAALAKAIDHASSSLTTQIVTGAGNDVFHCEWDNLNKITTNIHGSNIVNSTGGIMIQEVKAGYDGPTERKLPLVECSKLHQKVQTPESLASVHLFKRVGPKFPEEAVFTQPIENDEIYTSCLKECQVWLLARVVGSSHDKQPVPAFAGFVSATSNTPARKSTIDYFAPIAQEKLFPRLCFA